MSINIRFDVDIASAQSKLLQLKQGVVAQESKIDKVWNNVKTNYMYYTQLGSIMLTNLAKAAEGTAALSGIQYAQAGYTALIGEIAVGMTMKQAAAAFASPVPGMRLIGYILLTIAGMLQASVAAAFMAQIESLGLARQADEIARQLEMYNV